MGVLSRHGGRYRRRIRVTVGSIFVFWYTALIPFRSVPQECYHTFAVLTEKTIVKLKNPSELVFKTEGCFQIDY